MTPSNHAAVVTGLGMVTSLGRDVITSCAAARAGLTRSAELKVLDFHTEALFGRETPEGPPEIFGHLVRGVADGFTGLGKALLLGEAALEDLLARRPLSESERSSTGLVLNLSDHYVLDADAQTRGDEPVPSAAWRQQTSELHVRLAETCGLRSLPAHLVLRHGGHVGVALAVRDALALMARGVVDRCLICAIDSLAEPGFLRAAAGLKLLRTSDNPVGLIPGEAAAAFLLERPRDATRAGLAAVATLATAAVEHNDVDLLTGDPPPTGAGLAELLRPVLESSLPISFSIGDLNGTPHRAREWGGVLARLRARHRIADMPAWFPALSFGDTGAAVGAIGLCMAARAFARRYAPGDSALVWLSSENGAKGAIVLGAPKD